MKIYLALFLAFICTFVNAQFGVTKEGNIEPVAVDAEPQPEEYLTSLTEQDAQDISALIQAAGEDPDTIKLIAAMKDENAEDIAELKKLPMEEILEGLKMTLDEMKVMDVVFQDPVKAFEAMEEEKMIPEEHLETYRKDPKLLEDDTRKALYFRFISLAVVGDFM